VIVQISPPNESAVNKVSNEMTEPCEKRVEFSRGYETLMDGYEDNLLYIWS